MAHRIVVTPAERDEEERARFRTSLIISIMIAMFLGGVLALIPTNKHVSTSHTSTVVVGAKTTSTTPTTITVQKGDTLSAIREKHCPYMDYEQFEAVVCTINNLPNPDGLRIGTKLELPRANTDDF